MEIEKSIRYKIEQQFPAIFRENGPELVQLVKDYYEFMETETNMSLYNSRRLYEYRDIAQTSVDLLVQFHKTFMADLDLLDDQNLRLAVSNILSLYRRKGSPGSIKLFFRMFYQADAQISYPGKYITKPSTSSWRKGVYLQLFSNDGEFVDKDGNNFTYADLYGKNIRGSISEARAAVDTIGFIVINKTLTPFLYLSDVKGNFTRYDDIVAVINGNSVAFGRVAGSMSEIDIDEEYGRTSGHSPGDLFNVKSIKNAGYNGKAVVTSVNNSQLGTIEYTLTDKGYGYTANNTYIQVSNQVVVINNPNFVFEVEEYLEDSSGNRGFVVGQNAYSVGVKMDAGDTFDEARPISTADRSPNVLITQLTNAAIDLVTPKNETSPGDLYPDTGNLEDVRVSIDNLEEVSLITDVVSNFVNVPINSSNYNTIPPASVAMSGTADPVTLATRLDEAFDLTPFEIGSIKELLNIDEGINYTNDVWAIARDEVMRYYDRFEQIIVMTELPGNFSVGELVTGTSTGRTGIITDINTGGSYIKVRPYSYFGFTNADDVIYKGITYPASYVSRDYDGEKIGESADIFTDVRFESGQIATVDVFDSGIGYPDKDVVYLTDDDGTIHARAVVRSLTQGITEGYWASFNSHLSGWTEKEDGSGDLEYTNYEMKVQDSDYYQEYSYEIKSILGIERYEDALREHVHLAGSKMFGSFLYENTTESSVGARMIVGVKEDNEVGGDPIVGPNQVVAYAGGGLRADSRNYSVDSTQLSADITLVP
jgi:hypothetical protein